MEPERMKFPAPDPEGTTFLPHCGKSPAAVGLVGRDATFLRNLSLSLARNGFEAVAFSSPEEFLKESASRNLACMVVDLSWREMEGLHFGESFPDEAHNEPAFLISGQVNGATSMMALKTIAVHIPGRQKALPKLLSALRVALVESVGCSRQHELACLKERFSSLTPREMEILLHVLAGKLNKQIASALGIAIQTVKIHRMRITEKSGLVSVAELARAACLLGYEPAA